MVRSFKGWRSAYVIKRCAVCKNVRRLPPLHAWKLSLRPFQRVHLDFCQNGKDYFLVLIDSHSKWIDLKPMTMTLVLRERGMTLTGWNECLS